MTESVTLPVSAPPPVNPVPAMTLTVFGTAPLTAETEIAIDEFDADVRRPCASTVKLPTVLALP